MKISANQFLRQASPLKTRTPQNLEGPAPKPPADLVELRLKSQVGRANVGMLACLGVVGAAMTAAVLLTPGPGITVGQLGSTLQRQSAQQDRDTSMRFEVMPNAAGKIDLVRQHDSESDGNNGTRTVDRAHSPLGVYLGEGVFLDSNMNLSFVPSRVIHGAVMEPAQSVEVTGGQRATATTAGDTTVIERFGTDQTIRRLGADRVEFRTGSWGGPVQISRSGDTTTLQGGSYSYPVTITRGDQQVTVREAGLFGSSVETIISRSDNGYQVARNSLFGTKYQVSVNGSGQVEYKGTGISDAVVQRGENGIVVQRSAWLSGESTLNLRGDSLQETGPDGNFHYQVRR